MKIIKILFLAILTSAQFSCGQDNQAIEKANEVAVSADTSRAEEKPFANIQFASKFDTSCGMPITAGVEDTLHLNNKIYGFCSKGCKDEFVAKLVAEKKR